MCTVWQEGCRITNVNYMYVKRKLDNICIYVWEEGMGGICARSNATIVAQSSSAYLSPCSFCREKLSVALP